MKKVLIVEGMSCGHCKKAVETALGKLEGIATVNVDLSAKKVEVEGNNLVEELLKETIEDAGYDVVQIS